MPTRSLLVSMALAFTSLAAHAESNSLAEVERPAGTGVYYSTAPSPAPATLAAAQQTPAPAAAPASVTAKQGQ